MRPLLHGDVTALARAVLCVPRSIWEGYAEEIISHADSADAYRLRNGQVHPHWGNGSLMAAANAEPQLPEPSLDDRRYCAALSLVFRVLACRDDAAVDHQPLASVTIP